MRSQTYGSRPGTQCKEHLQTRGQKTTLWDTRTHYSFHNENFFCFVILVLFV